MSCHGPLLTRRQLMAGGAALAAAGALPARAESAADDGTALVRRWATLPDDPWAVCHGVRAMGRGMKLADGRPAVDWLLTQINSVSANGHEVLAFPRAVEVHPDMFLKVLVEADVPMSYTFAHKGRSRTLREVADSARALFRPSQVAGDPNLLPWSIIAFARTTSPPARWTNAWGEPVELDLVIERALRLLEEASLPLAQAMGEGRAESVRAPVHGFTCGGTHMLYALLTALASGYAGRDRAERVRLQTSVMVWRTRADLALIERFYKERAAQPGAYWYDLDAKVKLLGHAEECLAFGSRRGVVKLTEGQQRHRRAAVAELKRMIKDMEGRDVGETRRIDRELFRQLVGDTCHARRGLTLA